MKKTAIRDRAWLAHAAFWLAIVGVLAMGYYQYEWTSQAIRSAEDVGRSDQILKAGRTLEGEVARAESALRGYRLTGEPEYLAAHQRSRSALARLQAELAALTRDDAEQAARVREVEGRLAVRVALMDQVLSDFAKAGPPRRNPRAAAGAAISAPVYEAIGAVLQRESAQREARALLHERRYEAATRILWLSIAACVLCLLGGYVMFVLQARARGRAERRLTDLAENAPGALFRYRQIRGGRSRYEFVSHNVTELLGADREAAMRDPKSVYQLVVPEDRPKLAAAIRAAARRLGRFEHEFRVRATGGDVRWIRSTASLRADADGSVLWNGYWADVTHERRAQEERDSFFTLSLDMLCIAGADGYIKQLNPAFTETLGWSAEELMSRPFIEFVHPDDVEATVKVHRKQIEDRRPLLHFENRYLHKDGSIRVLAWRSVPRSDGLFFATARDVTEQTRTRSELVKAKEDADAASRAKSTFLATMSHEIRTPLAGVLGMLELLSLTQLDSEQRRTVETVRHSGESLKRIIDDILEFSKIEAGRLDIQAETASVAVVVAGVRNIYASLASSKGLLLEASVDPHISPALVVDALRLQQILNNFVSNALKFTSAGKVSIVAQLVEREDGIERVRFTVTDTGIGIPADRQEALFQPFTQAESDTTRRFGGTGLGLAISRRLADLMGGRIEMESEVGKGTRMILLLPMPIGDPDDLPAGLRMPGAVAPPVVRRARTAPPREQARAEGTLVLVADDHITNRELLARQLAVLGYATETAEDGAQALQLWRTGDYGLVLADCNMPVMDGYELSRRIREVEEQQGLKRTPIIACTANALRGEAENCLNAGMDGYLPKPVQLVELQKKIGAWLPLPEQLPDQLTGEFAVLPPPATPDDRRVTLDGAALAVISGGDRVMEREILRDFRRINEADAQALRQAVENQDLDTVRRASHRIKGASQMVGAAALATVCERLEKASITGNWPAIRADLGAFRDAIERLNDAIGEG